MLSKTVKCELNIVTFVCEVVDTWKFKDYLENYRLN